MIQETLEEVAKSHAIYELENNYKPTKESFKLACKRNFIRGAKWQQERSYSFDELRLWLIERDVYLYNYYTTYKKSGIPMENVDKYIEDSHEYLMGRKQFKKK